MLGHTHFRTVKLIRWFPADDPLAAKIARLCILKEDLLIEWFGLKAADTVEELDHSSSAYRSTYFLRGFIRSLSELASALHRLVSDPNFKVLLAKQTKELRTRFSDANMIREQVRETMKELRNAICGHVKESSIQEVLNVMSPDEIGIVEIGPKMISTHYKFAHNLVAGVFVKDMTPEEKRTSQVRGLQALADYGMVFILIDECVKMYIIDRRLHRLGR
jgi:hypothetical protein